MPFLFRGKKMFKWAKKTSSGVKDKVVNEGKTLLGVEEAKKYGNRIIYDAKNSLNPFAVKKGRQESFESAILRMGLTEEDIRQSYSNHQLRFYIGISIFLVAIIVLIKMLLQSNWFAIGPAIACMAICISQIFDGSFRTYQIRRRELVSVSEWFADRKEWWPSKLLTVEETEQLKRRLRKTKKNSIVKK